MRFLILVPFLLLSNLQALAQGRPEQATPLAEFYIDLNSWVERVSFSADGSRFALAHIGDEGLSIGVYEGTTAEQIATFHLPEIGGISSLSLDPFGEGLAAAFRQSRGQMWHVDSQMSPSQFDRRSLAGAREAIWSPDGAQIAWQFEHGLSLMDAATATILKNYRTTEDAFVDWHGDQLRILNIWSNRDKLRVSYTSSNGEKAEWELEYPIYSPSVSWRADGRAFFLIEDRNDRIYHFDLDNQEVLHNQDGRQDDLPDTFRARYNLLDLAFSPTSDLYAVSVAGDGVFVVDGQTHELQSTCDHTVVTSYDQLAWAPDGSLIAMYNDYGPFFFCDPVSGRLLGLDLSFYSRSTHFLAWGPGDDQLMLIDPDLGHVSVWPAPLR